MKTILQVIIETPDASKLEIYEDPEKSEDDYTAEELKDYREEFARSLHNVVCAYTESQLNIVDDEENILEWINDSELSIENWDSITDYGVKIIIEQVKK